MTQCKTPSLVFSALKTTHGPIHRMIREVAFCAPIDRLDNITIARQKQKPRFPKALSDKGEIMARRCNGVSRFIRHLLELKNKKSKTYGVHGTS